MRSKPDPVDQPKRTAHYDCAMCIAEMLHKRSGKKVRTFHVGGNWCRDFEVGRPSCRQPVLIKTRKSQRANS